MNHKKLIILGFGGHARSVADVALANGYASLIFVDSNAAPNETFLGHPVIKTTEMLDPSWREAFPASGDPKIRQAQCAFIESAGLTLVSLVSPRATIGAGATIKAGVFVGHHAHVGPMATIGHACIVNTSAVVEHESSTGDYSHVSVGAIVAGRSRIGNFSLLGAGATIIDGRIVADHVTIGAGAVVAKSIDEPGTYVGVPARKVKLRAETDMPKPIHNDSGE